MPRRKELAWPVLEEESYRQFIRPQETQQQGENTFSVTCLDQDLFPKGLFRAQNSGCTYMYTHACLHARMSADNHSQKVKED